MTLNYSLRPLFPAHISEENIVSPMKNIDGLRQWQSSRDGGGDNMDWENVLPADPFGMNISSIFTAITELLGACGQSKVVGVSKGDCSFFAEINVFMDFHPLLGNKKGDENIFIAYTVDTCLCKELWHPLCNGGLNIFCTMDHDKIRERMISKEMNHPFDDELFNFACTRIRRENPQQGDKMLMVDTVDGPLCGNKLASHLCDGGFHFACTMDMNKETQRATTDTEEPHSVSDPYGREPHEALGFALAYLGVRDLLSVERVCKSLCDSVNDSLLWRNVHIEEPLNDRITDDILLRLTRRSQGNLQCMSLVECQRITDDGLKRILESNLSLTKLSVPGCTRLSIDGIVSGLRAFKLVASPGIKRLRIGGLYGVTQKHFDEVMSLMDIQNHAQANRNTPLFYHRGDFYLSYEDERPIDIETCPRCEKLRLVYDCPAESCRGKNNVTQSCRACTLCISRCVQCGKCFTDGEYVENFCLEFICSVCWKQSSRCQDTHPSPFVHSEPREHVSSSHG